MTQLLHARRGNITEAMRSVARDEEVSAEQLCHWVATGRVVIPANPHHGNLHPCVAHIAPSRSFEVKT